jgi:hypothetical protein
MMIDGKLEHIKAIGFLFSRLNPRFPHPMSADGENECLREQCVAELE